MGLSVIRYGDERAMRRIVLIPRLPPLPGWGRTPRRESRSVARQVEHAKAFVADGGRERGGPDGRRRTGAVAGHSGGGDSTGPSSG